MTTLSAELIITTVIPTYRRPRLLRRAILSVLNQTYPNVRVCVYDNASGDETEEVVAQMTKKDSRVRYYRHPENIGSFNNFNYGLQEVKTPFFSLLSDDDVLVPTFYEEAIKAFRQYPETMLVCMPTMVVDSLLNVISGPIQVMNTTFYAPGEAVKGMIEVNIPATWTGIVFRKEVRDQIGLINPNAGPHADGGFVYHAAARFPLVAIPGIGAVLMAHDNSTSRTVLPIGIGYMHWWNTMMRAIYEDGKVPLDVKEYILSRELHPNYKNIGISQVGRALAKGDYKYAKEAAQGIGECGYPLTGKMIKLFIWSCRIIPLLQRVVVALRESWRRFHIRKNKMLHQKYGHLVAFIKEYE
jgi:glycosyltransferase involved in cell wall biosynthesis